MHTYIHAYNREWERNLDYWEKTPVDRHQGSRVTPDIGGDTSEDLQVSILSPVPFKVFINNLDAGLKGILADDT